MISERLTGFVLGTGFAGMLALANTIMTGAPTASPRWWYPAAAVTLAFFALVLLVMLMRSKPRGE